MMAESLLTVRNLEVHFGAEPQLVRAVDGISFSLARGEVLGLVGESGSGKSVTALSILRLVDRPGRIVGGELLYSAGGKAPQDLLQLTESEMRRVRGSEIAMIFQEPMTALNPVYTIGNQIEEGIRVHRDLSKHERQDKVLEALRQVQIPDPARVAKSYPHELSGGMRQRAMIAMALACQPRLLLVDEPTTALDVTIQAQILNLLKDLQESLGMAMLFITHDLGVVAQLADRVLVMQKGQVVEEGTVRKIFQQPTHPYTQMLLRAVPRFTTRSVK